jgi:hypothetical protein
MPTIYYVWLHQVDRKTNWVVNEKHVSRLVLEPDTNLSWTNVRYFLESKWFSKGKDFIVSVPELNDHEVLKDGTKLVLKRLPGNNNKLFVPYAFQSNAVAYANLSEDEKIHQIMELSRATHPTILHPSRLHNMGPAIPAPSYVCAYCFEKGSHYVKDCPRKEKDLPARKVPAGLPKTFLRLAKTAEEKERAFITTTGEYVVLKNSS